jgi:hypothetical protein
MNNWYQVQVEFRRALDEAARAIRLAKTAEDVELVVDCVAQYASLARSGDVRLPARIVAMSDAVARMKIAIDPTTTKDPTKK